MTVNFSFKFYW